MANTYHQIYLHAVYAVKYRNSLIEKPWDKTLFGVTGTLLNQSNCKTIIVNGVADHVHCLFGIKPVIAPSNVLQIIKAGSSKHINDHSLTRCHFNWQDGFGIFSVERSSIDRLYKYIQNQEEHHKKISFREEYILLLEEYGVEFDEKYLFHDPL